MKKIGFIVILTSALAGQAQAGGWNGDALLGGAVGGAAGAAIGSALGGRDAAIVGGLLGGATGVAVATRDYDRRHAAPVYYRPAPVRQVYQRYDYAPPPGYRHRHQFAYGRGQFHDHGRWHGPAPEQVYYERSVRRYDW